MMRPLIIVLACFLALTVGTIYASGFQVVDGRIVATTTEEAHKLINAKNTYPTGGTFENANTLILQHLSQTGCAAAMFEDYQGRERGAVGFCNGEEVGSTFPLAGYNYLSGGCFTPDAQPCPAGTSNGVIAAMQHGFYQGTYRDAARIMCHKTTWVCGFYQPPPHGVYGIGTPIFTVDPAGMSTIYNAAGQKVLVVDMDGKSVFYQPGGAPIMTIPPTGPVEFHVPIKLMGGSTLQ